MPLSWLTVYVQITCSLFLFSALEAPVQMDKHGERVLKKKVAACVTAYIHNIHIHINMYVYASMNVSVGRIVFQAKKLLYAALQDWANHLKRRVCMLRVKILNFYIIT